MDLERRELDFERDDRKEFFFEKENLKIEAVESASKWFTENGIETRDLKYLDRRFLQELPHSFERIFEEHPEMEGYITSVCSKCLPEGVLARTGPYLNKNGEYAGAEIQFSETFFGKKNYELKIANMESDVNWRGERWLAGRGADGVINHEAAHVMALRLNAEDAEIQIGEINRDKFNDLLERYGRDSRIVSICESAINELGINHADLGREVSAYGSSGGFGELFAEAMSEYATQKKPRRLSAKIHEKYINAINEKKMEEAS